MSFIPQLGAPPTNLGRYRQLAPRAAIHVSPLQLGDGNFIDTANFYQDGESESFIGEWMEARGIRDQVVVATKYTSTPFRVKGGLNQANYVGNNIKSLKLSLEVSLKRLRTNYIDILYVHFPDNHTSAEEIMDGLHALVQQGTVLYLGISNSPAWFVMKCNDYAKAYGKTPFVIYQGPYSVLQRDLEREIIPMCQHEGIALAFWNVLAAGKIRTDEEENRRRESGEKGRLGVAANWKRNEREKKMSIVLEKIAGEVGTKHVTAVAIAYTLQKAPFVFPIVGGRKVEHLQANIEALNIRLTPEQIKTIESAVLFEVGEPYNASGPMDQYPFFVKAFAHFDPQPLLPPILPKEN